MFGWVGLPQKQMETALHVCVASMNGELKQLVSEPSAVLSPNGNILALNKTNGVRPSTRASRSVAFAQK